MLSAALTNRFDDAYHCGPKSSLSHACAVLSYSDFVFDWSGHAICNLLMFSIVSVILSAGSPMEKLQSMIPALYS